MPVHSKFVHNIKCFINCLEKLHTFAKLINPISARIGSGFGSMPSGGDVVWPNLDETQRAIHTRVRLIFQHLLTIKDT